MALLFHSVFLFVGYWVTSIGEWLFHRYCMHATNNDLVPTKAFKDINKQHIIHHKATKLEDMSVTPTVDKYKKKKLSMKYQRFQGLYFIWPVSFAIALGTFFGGLVLNFLLRQTLKVVIGYDLSYSTAIVYAILMAVYMSLVWNYVHPTLHLQPGLDLADGLDLIPRLDWIENSAFYCYLWKNHVYHHLCVGANAGNFNVTLPGGDWLFSTYRTQCDGWKVDAKKKKIYKLKK